MSRRSKEERIQEAVIKLRKLGLKKGELRSKRLQISIEESGAPWVRFVPSSFHLPRLLPLYLFLILFVTLITIYFVTRQSATGESEPSTAVLLKSSSSQPVASDAKKNRQGQSSGTRKNEGGMHKPGQNENTRRAATSETQKQSSRTETVPVPAKTESGESSVQQSISEKQPQQKQASQPVSGGQSDLNEQQQGLGQEGQTTPISSSPPQNQREAPVSEKEKAVAVILFNVGQPSASRFFQAPCKQEQFLEDLRQALVQAASLQAKDRFYRLVATLDLLASGGSWGSWEKFSQDEEAAYLDGVSPKLLEEARNAKAKPLDAPERKAVRPESPVEWSLFAHFGEVGIKIWRLIDGKRNANEIMLCAGTDLKTVLSVMEWLEKEHHINLDKKEG